MTRVGPTASATAFPEQTRFLGGDGMFWTVRRGSGSKRWVRTGPPLTALTSDPGVCVLNLTLPVVMDDKLGERSREVAAKPGLSYPTRIPAAARATLRKMILGNNAFYFHDLLLTGVPKLQPRSAPSASPWSRLFSFWRKKSSKRASASLISLAILERGAENDHWSVEMLWQVDCPRQMLDMEALMSDLSGQLSDGWGEGVEQMRFGPIVICEDEENDAECRLAIGSDERSLDVTTFGRWSFNLTIALEKKKSPWTLITSVR